MEHIDAHDLMEGRNEWCNIPDVLRASLKILVDELRVQKQQNRERLDDLQRFAQQRLDALETTTARIKKDMDIMNNSILERLELVQHQQQNLTSKM